MFRSVVTLFLLFAVWAPAQVVPDLFIVEMDDAAKGARQASSVSKSNLRLAVEERSGQVLDSFERVMDALVVRMDEQQAMALAGVPGVRKVYRVLEAKPHLDGAIPQHRVWGAWEAVGGYEKAGAGVGIAIIDTGIEARHAGFQDRAIAVPAGFPRGNRDSDLAGANEKVIVARSYENLITPFADPNTSDGVGHGTAVAMAAAGVWHKAPFADLVGVAPRAWLGNYKVFTSSGTAPRSDVIIRAIEDAVNDGMKVINMSLGFDVPIRLEDDAVARAIQRAAEAGVVVVKSAGNEGPGPNTTSSPAPSPYMISVGASANERTLSATATVADARYLALPAIGAIPSEPLRAPMVDVATLAENGLACDPLPEGSLRQKIALIERGTCLFADKLGNAERAGAAAALLFTDDREVDTWSGSITLPALMIGREDGLRVKALLAETPGLEAALRFQGSSFPSDPNRVAGFSSRGPSYYNGISPDLVAVGQNFYTAAQSANRNGDVYGADGYVTVQGTSFSSPLVAGAAAMVIAARPGLTVPQYRSLLINSARALIPSGGETPFGVQQAGAGTLDVVAALRVNAAANPTSISFGAGGTTVDIERQFAITNVGAASDVFSVTVVPYGDTPAPQISVNSFFLEPKAAQNIGLRFARSRLDVGEYQGVLLVRGANTDAELRIPYWYAASDGQPFQIALSEEDPARANAAVTIEARVLDRTGVVLNDFRPEVTVISGDGIATSVRSLDAVYPGVWELRVRLGPVPGNNVFEIRAGETTRRITIRGT